MLTFFLCAHVKSISCASEQAVAAALHQQHPALVQEHHRARPPVRAAFRLLFRAAVFPVPTSVFFYELRFNSHPLVRLISLSLLVLCILPLFGCPGIGDGEGGFGVDWVVGNQHRKLEGKSKFPEEFQLEAGAARRMRIFCSLVGQKSERRKTPLEKKDPIYIYTL